MIQKGEIANGQRIGGWLYKGQKVTRVLIPGKPEYREWQDGRKFTEQEELDFEQDLRGLQWP